MTGTILWIGLCSFISASSAIPAIHPRVDDDQSIVHGTQSFRIANSTYTQFRNFKRSEINASATSGPLQVFSTDSGGDLSSMITSSKTRASDVQSSSSIDSTRYIFVSDSNVQRHADSSPALVPALLPLVNEQVKRARPAITPTGTSNTATVAPQIDVSTTVSTKSDPTTGTPSPSISLSSGKKAGVAYNAPNHVDLFIGKPNIGWAYNWASNPEGISNGIEYVPLLWGASSTFTNTWVSNANSAVERGATAVIGFNEPDHARQANLDYNTAASAYKQYITDNFAGKIKLVSPSVTNGPAPMGLAYLSNFMNACSDCGINVINLHWYDVSSNTEYFKSYIQGAYDQFNLPIWLTEFGTTDRNDQAFLKSVQPWLDSQSYVERYAYFMAEDGKLLSGDSLNAAGQTYAGS